MAATQTKRTSVVLNALRVTMRSLQAVPESPEAEKLRQRAIAFERETERWPSTSPSNYEREAMMKQVLALPLREAREQFERAYLQQQLLLCNGKVGQLAKRVGMERTHLYRKLRALGVDFRNITED